MSNQMLPYLVTEAYPASEESLDIPLGHGIRVQLAVSDAGGVIRGSTADDLRGTSPDEAYEASLLRLFDLVKAGEVFSTVIPEGPSGRPFALFADHWTVAAAILLPQLTEVLAAHLGTELVAAIPHREVLLVFPAAEGSDLTKIVEFVRQMEGDTERPLTDGLFRLGGRMPNPIAD